MQISFVKKLVLLGCLFLGLGAKAQDQTIFEGFENWPPEDWSIFTLGAGNGWVQDWQGISYAGNYSALTSISNSQCDSWLVTPQVSVISNNYQLKFYEYNISPEFFDNTAIYVSTGSNNPESGDFEQIYVTESVLPDWTERVIDLSAYEGQNIYIGFQHEGTYHAWLIDEVSVSPSEFTDVAAENIVSPNGVSSETGSQEVVLSVRNYGTTSIDDLSVSWSVNGIEQTAYDATNLELASGQEIELGIGSFDFSETGYYDILVNVNSPGDEISNNNSIEYTYQISNFKNAQLVRVKPEGMTPSAGSQDVRIGMSNLGQNRIDSLRVYWTVNDAPQSDYQNFELGLDPGDYIEINIGEFTFESGLNELLVEIDALGDISPENDQYLSYLPVDTIWESFEGFEFPPDDWSIIFGVRDNANFGIPKQGNYYYSASPDNNFFGAVSDTLYTPFLNIQEGDVFTINIETSGFLDASHSLIAEDIDGNIITLQEISAEPSSWIELEMDISQAAGIHKIGVTSSVEDGPGLTKFDLFTSTASLHEFSKDLKLQEGDMEILARKDITQNFVCTVKNQSADIIIGSEYDVLLVDEDGNILSSESGQIIQPQQEISFTLPYTFSDLGEQNLHFEISIETDEFVSNNSSQESVVHVIPNTSVFTESGSQDFLTLNLPFNANGNTNSLGEDDASQTIYSSDLFTSTGDIYGFTYSFSNILNVDNPKKLPLKVWVKQVETDNLSDGFIPTSELILVFDDTLEFKSGQREIYIPFDEPFSLNGIDNLLVQNHQYDPEWPPAILSFWNVDMPSDGTIRSVVALDVFNLDPEEGIEFYNNLEDIPYTRFVIDPIVDFGVISGQVVSSADNMPIEGVEVSVMNSSISSLTDENGFYILPELPYGEYNLTAVINGYDEESVTLDLDQSNYQQDFILNPLIPIQISGTVFGSNDLVNGLSEVEVSLSGYSTDMAVTDMDGDFILESVFSSSEYQIAFSFYGYETTIIEVSTQEENIDLGDIILNQIFISPFNVQAQPETDGVTLVWENPQESQDNISQNDLDVCSFSYTNEPNEDVWLGNIFEVEGLLTITDIEFKTDIYENAIDFVTLEVLDLDGNVLSTSEPVSIYADSLYVVDVPNIVVDQDVFVGVHWQNNPISTNALCVDFSDENIPNTAAIRYPGEGVILLSDFFGEGSPNLSFIVRIHSLGEGDNLSNDEELSYNIYRGLSADFPDFSNWEQINDGPITDLSLFDDNWEGFDPTQTYRYAVETIYTEGFSEVTFSNIINGIALGMENPQPELSLELYPNPTSDFFTLRFESDRIDQATVEIFNSQGTRVYRSGKVSSKESLNINAREFKPGFYLVRIDLNGLVLSRKLVVSE